MTNLFSSRRSITQATNDGFFSVRIKDPNTNATLVGFYSKESTPSSYHPALQFVNPGNTAPNLTAISNRTINAGITLNLTNLATDADLPAQTLTFSLPSAPTNATINASSGVLTWRPFVTQADTTNIFTVAVTDSGTPTKSATQSFVVTVNALAKPQISIASLTAGQMVLQANGASGPDYQVQTSTNLADWSILFTTNSPPMPFVWTNNFITNLPAQFFKVVAGPPLP